ncbi:ABC transporter substrate-binding protein [Streptantibioticus ferralitis]|uniref:ABC transporter substrate-binding protein n=1 Tax=Streptantibioticus ferralitis TaxID=236510 RepID=A0ABT5ZCK0_9ACTN|nr:ABC transporter substrate-binding protein [Streptantibioticus ferralitis]MDF2261582.1 ABC transporter substrate-binding protein [Streptantibioticus ferralitis]
MTATRRFGVLAAAATIMIGGVSGCAPTPETGAATDSKDPVVVMTWAPQGTNSTNLPGMPAMAEAYARMVNAEGGINGRPLKVLTCDEHNDSVRAERCAQQAVSSHAVAVVGSYSQYGQSFMASLENAGIPYLGGYGVAPEEFTSPLSYPVNGGAPALLAGNGRQLSSICNRTALIRPDSAAGDQYPEYLDAGLAFRHRAPADDIRAPDDATDYTGAAQRAIGSGDPGSCVTAVLGDRTATFFDSFRRIGGGSQVRTASVLGSVKQSLLDSTGGADSPLEGAYATSWYPPANDPAWNTMRTAVSTYAFGDNRIDVADPGAETTWIAYTVFTKIARSLGHDAITAQSVHDALGRAHDISTGGLTPPLGWRYADMLAVRGYPRMVNATVTYQVVRSGQLTAVGKGGFVDVRSTLEGT